MRWLGRVCFEKSNWAVSAPLAPLTFQFIHSVGKGASKFNQRALLSVKRRRISTVTVGERCECVQKSSMLLWFLLIHKRPAFATLYVKRMAGMLSPKRLFSLSLCALSRPSVRPPSCCRRSVFIWCANRTLDSPARW